MKLRKLILFENGTGEGAGGGGGAAAGASTGSEGAHSTFDEGEGQGAGQGIASTEEGAGAAGAAAQGSAQGGAAALTPEAIAAAIKAAGIGQPQQSQPQTPPKQYTQEDFDKAFNVWNPDENLVKSILAGGPDALKSLVSMRDGMIRQAVTMAAYMIEQGLEKHKATFEPEFNSIRDHVKEQQVTKLYADFYKKNPDLKPYDSLVRVVVDKMKADNVTFKTVDEAFADLATRVKATIKNLPAAGAEGNGAGNQGSTRMPALSAGGQSGAGGSRGGAGQKSAAHAVFSR